MSKIVKNMLFFCLKNNKNFVLLNITEKPIEKILSGEETYGKQINRRHHILLRFFCLVYHTIGKEREFKFQYEMKCTQIYNMLSICFLA